jgi:hypothetical protein
MDETNLLNLIRLLLDNIYQITTKTLQYRFTKNFGIQTVPQCDKWNLCLSSTSDDDARGCHKEKMGSHYSTGQLAAAPSLPKSLTYHDISIEQISAKIDVVNSSSSGCVHFAKSS